MGHVIWFWNEAILGDIDWKASPPDSPRTSPEETPPGSAVTAKEINGDALAQNMQRGAPCSAGQQGQLLDTSVLGFFNCNRQH